MKDIEIRIKELEDELKELREEEKMRKEQREPKPWKPEVEEKYFYIGNALEIGSYLNWDDPIDDKIIKAGNCFSTKERAEQVARKIRLLLRLEQLHDMLCLDYEPDWNNPRKQKICLGYDHADDCWFVDDVDDFNITEYPTAYFDTEENAEKAAEILNKEMKRGKK